LSIAKERETASRAVSPLCEHSIAYLMHRPKQTSTNKGLALCERSPGFLVAPRRSRALSLKKHTMRCRNYRVMKTG
jgi:hypothetical protein